MTSDPTLSLEITEKTYIDRRQALRAALPQGVILLPGQGEAPRNYLDNPYPFRQDSHFLYYTGINHAGLALVIKPDGREVLYGRPEHPDDTIWHGPHATLIDFATQAGIAATAPIEELAGLLSELAKKGEEIHYLPPYRAERTIQLAIILKKPITEIGAAYSQELAIAVTNQRNIKTEAEIAQIEAALATTANMYRSAYRTARPGVTEAQVMGAIQGAALKQDRQMSFPPIVSVRGEVLHNHSYANTLAHGDLLVMDSGAESPLFYASDITRTIPVGGKFTAQQKEIYQIVLAAQQAAIEQASPKVSNKELHFLAAQTIADGLKEIGLMRGDTKEAVAQGAHALFFPHGLGHMMGLDVHDMEDLGDIVGYPVGKARSPQFGTCYLRLARQLEPGFVITIEPGIYFIPALINRWAGEKKFSAFIHYEKVEQYVGFGGIRLEDDILITSTGCRVLGEPIPKSLEEVEAAMAE